MKRTIPIAMALGLFAAGAFVGQLATNTSRAQAPAKAQAADPALTSALTEQTRQTLNYLTGLRKGNTEEVMRLMENHLDNHVVKLGGILETLPAAERNPQSLRVIKEFKDYREKNPHQNQDPRVYNGLPKVYKLLESDTK